jgi:hypothetical protein
MRNKEIYKQYSPVVNQGWYKQFKSDLYQLIQMAKQDIKEGGLSPPTPFNE